MYVDNKENELVVNEAEARWLVEIAKEVEKQAKDGKLVDMTFGLFGVSKTLRIIA